MTMIQKTFADGEILTATDVNGALNPTTADNIACAVATGQTSIAFAASSSATAAGITLPAGRFSRAPYIVVTAASDPAGGERVILRAVNVTSTTFDVKGYTGNAANVTATVWFSWFAVQMKPGSTAG
mgnify:CR=1 FL=1